MIFPKANQPKIRFEYVGHFRLLFGEVMLKTVLPKKGYKWGTDNFSNIPLLVNADGSFVTPNDKVYKRLVNGKEDSVISFYDVIMSMD